MLLRIDDLMERLQRIKEQHTDPDRPAHLEITIKSVSFETELPVRVVIIESDSHLVLKVETDDLVEQITDHPAYQQICQEKAAAGISRIKVVP
jgi:hypothetical protein